MTDIQIIFLACIVAPVCVLCIVGWLTERPRYLPPPRMDRIVRTHKDAWDVSAGRVR